MYILRSYVTMQNIIPPAIRQAPTHVKRYLLHLFLIHKTDFLTGSVLVYQLLQITSRAILERKVDSLIFFQVIVVLDYVWVVF